MIYENFSRLTDDRIVASLIGMPKAKFTVLVEAFKAAECAIDLARVEKGEIKQLKSGGAKGYLDSYEKKLFFVLFYLKTYPTFDVLGFHFGFSGGHAHAHIDKLLPVLGRALENLNLMPERTATTPIKFSQLIEKYKNIAIDGVECACVRPGGHTEQEKHYSGKKRPTVKSLVMTDFSRKRLFLGGVVAGSLRDYQLMKTLFNPGSAWFRKVSLWVDLGFLGVDKDYQGGPVHLPHKKPRKSKKNPAPRLTPAQKKENRNQAATRVVVEHAIGGMKFFHCLMHRIKNYLDTFVDYFFSLAAGLWNYKIS